MRVAWPPRLASTRLPWRDVQSILTPSPRTWPVLRPSRLEAVSSFPRSASHNGSAHRKRHHLGNGLATPAPTLDLRGPRFQGSAPPRTQSPGCRPVPTRAAVLAEQELAKRCPRGCHRGRSHSRLHGPLSGRKPAPRHRRRQCRGTNQIPSQGTPLRQRQPIGTAAGPF